MHTATEGSSVEGMSFSLISARTQYSGKALAVARAVCDAGAGGMVLASEVTFVQLSVSRHDGESVGLHCGQHALAGTDSEPVNVYALAAPDLLLRLASLPNPRSLHQLQLGALQAPFGEPVIVFVKVPGADALMSWNAAVTKEALAMLHSTLEQQLLLFEGYLMERADAFMLVAFRSASAAIRCAALLAACNWQSRVNLQLSPAQCNNLPATCHNNQPDHEAAFAHAA